MYATDAFHRLPPSKKQHIINICIEEFAEHGYDRTSTDKIVEKAGISKGILFHYFRNKRNLYLHMVHHASRILTEVVMDGADEIREEDFFERIKRLIVEKQRVMLQYATEAKLCAEALMNPPPELAKEMGELLQDYFRLYQETQYNTLYPRQLIREDKLRPGVTSELVIEITRMIVEKVTEKYSILYKGREYDLLGNQGPLVEELDRLFRIIRHGVYRE